MLTYQVFIHFLGHRFYYRRLYLIKRLSLISSRNLSYWRIDLSLSFSLFAIRLSLVSRKPRIVKISLNWISCSAGDKFYINECASVLIFYFISCFISRVSLNCRFVTHSCQFHQNFQPSFYNFHDVQFPRHGNSFRARN